MTTFHLVFFRTMGQLNVNIFFSKMPPHTITLWIQALKYDLIQFIKFLLKLIMIRIIKMNLLFIICNL